MSQLCLLFDDIIFSVSIIRLYCSGHEWVSIVSYRHKSAACHIIYSRGPSPRAHEAKRRAAVQAYLFLKHFLNVLDGPEFGLAGGGTQVLLRAERHALV